VPAGWFLADWFVGVFVCWGLVWFGLASFVVLVLFLLESLILAQDERWRRA
jgi:hypothetical protein